MALWNTKKDYEQKIETAKREKATSLNLVETIIKDLKQLEGLTQLKDLDLSSTQVTDLKPLKGLTSLTYLFLNSTQVTDVKPLERLKNLYRLDLSSTQVTDLKPLEGLTQLKELDLSSTQVTDLKPLEDMIKKGIEVKWKGYGFSGGVYVEDCPLTNPPPEIVKQGNAAILRYFEELNRQGANRLFEAKVLLVGEGRVGKTTLLRKLQNPEEDLPNPEETTHGIDIHPMTYKNEEGQEVTMHTWDFGGQEIYKATHQFFLTKRSLYVLVDDASRDDVDLSYWLQSVETLAGGSPVILVQNHKQGRIKNIDLNGLRARFGFIKEYYGFDFSLPEEKDRDELARLLQDIKYKVLQLPHMGDVLPKQWVAIREEIQELSESKDTITENEFVQLCKNNTLTRPQQISDLSSYLHDLGAFLHFQDDMFLKRTIVLKKEWATEAVYRVLDNPRITTEKGRFSDEHLKEIWNEPAFCNHQPELINLMKRFELAYSLTDHSYLAPLLFSEEKPDLHWDKTQNLRMVYQYAFLPKGVMSRFIVRMNHLVKDPDKAWRRGAVLVRNKTQALVEETYDRGRIEIRVKGPDAKALMTRIDEDFDLLHETYSDLEVDKKIPCNCVFCYGYVQEGKDPHFYLYKNLIRRIEKGRDTVECEISYEDVPVKLLLDAVFTQEKIKPRPSRNIPKVFFSYSKEDESFLIQLNNHLAPLKRNKNLVAWSDHELLPGETWDESIQEELHAADIILFLVSSNFLATDYIMDVELPLALERKKKEGVEVVPIILRPCLWQTTKLGDLNALPRKGEPISKWEDADDAYVDIVEGIEGLIGMG